MDTKLKGLWEKIKAFFIKMNKKTRILLGVCAGIILVLIVAAAVMLSNKPYGVLYTGLSSTETSSIMGYLSDNGIMDYQVSGDSILVPENQVSQLQAQLALAGYPTTGALFPYYTEHSGGLTTNSQLDRAYLISTMEKLEGIFRKWEGIRDVDVVISPGSEQTYVFDDPTPASASVTLFLDNGVNRISDQMANAIRNAVSHAQEGLEIGNVSIVDDRGNTYTGELSSIQDASALKLQYEEQINNRVRTQVMESLGAIYGRDNVKVAVNSVVDVDRRVIESTAYRQPEGAAPNAGLIGSEHIFWEIIRDGTEPVGGPVGTESNADLPTYPNREPDLNGNETYAGNQTDKDYNTDTTVEQREVMAGTITDVSVSVTINQDAPNANSVDTATLRGHVAMAAGIGGEMPENRVSVLIAPFEKGIVAGPSAGIQLEPWVLYAGIGGLVLFLIVLVIVLLILKKKKKKKKAKQLALEEEAAAAAAAEAAAILASVPVTTGADIMEINTEKSMELRKSVRQFAQSNPEIAAQIVKMWLKGENEDA